MPVIDQDKSSEIQRHFAFVTQCGKILDSGVQGNKEMLCDLRTHINQLIEIIPEMSPTVESLRDFLEFLDNPSHVFNQFRSFWGRGQQYLSFIKTA